MFRVINPPDAGRAPSVPAEQAVAVDTSFNARVVRSTVTNVGLSVLLKGLLFVQSVILARMFAPADLGLLTGASLAVSLAMLFGQTGADQAIVCHRDVADERAMVDTALTMNLIVSTGLYLILLLGAPEIAHWAGRSDSTAYIRLIGVLTFGTALRIPSALWIKHFRFGMVKIPQFADFTAFLGTTVVFHELGFGVWSLFCGKIAGFVANYGSLWALVPYRPRLRLDPRWVREFLAFGWPLLVNGLCMYLVWQGDQWLILYFWGSEQLAYYALAFTLSFYLKDLVDLASAALFPWFARVQGTRQTLSMAFSDSNRFLAILTVPGGVALSAFASPIIEVLYTNRWAPAVPLLQLFGLGTMLSVVLGYNWGSLALSAGKTKLLLYVNFWIIALLGTVGVYAVSRFGPAGGAMFLIFQVSLTALLVRFPIIYGELQSLAFLLGIWRPLLAGAMAGWISHVAIVPTVSTVPSLLAGLAAFGGLYGALLVLLDRRLIGEIRHLVSVALLRR